MSESKRQPLDNYIFQRNTNATARLNYQYYLWQDALGFLLHPSIPKLGPNARVADVATGSGIWLFDVARDCPADIKLMGFDISLQQLPHPSHYPSNVAFQPWDFFEPAPEELRGSFDLVHIRLIGVAIKNEDTGAILKNIKRLLKPGGYLQWEEPDDRNITIVAPPDWTDSSQLPGLNGFKDLISEELKGSNGQTILHSRKWNQNIPTILRDQGFEDVEKFAYQERPTHGSFHTVIYELGAEEFMALMLTKDEALAQKLRDMIDNARQENQMGAWLSNPKAVYVARMPPEG